MLSQLYRVYENQFPNRPFWENLAKNEIIHFQWLQKLYQLAPEKKIFIDEEKFKTAAIQTSIEYLLRLINEAASCSLVNALVLALDIEQAMIEKKYFEVFKTDSAEIQDIMKQLEKATLAHVYLVKKELEGVNLQIQSMNLA